MFWRWLHAVLCGNGQGDGRGRGKGWRHALRCALLPPGLLIGKDVCLFIGPLVEGGGSNGRW